MAWDDGKIIFPGENGMKRKAALGAALAFLLLLAGRGISLPGPETPPETLRERGRALYNEGNYGEALEIYERLVFHPRSSALLVGDDLDMAVTCLRNLNREAETDSLRERAVEARAGDWRFLRRVAESYFNANHYGYIVAGEFLRGHHRGGGRYVNSFERDRVRALQLMQSAMAGTEGEAVAGAVAEFYLSFARMLIGYRGYQGAWRLQYLTDLDLLPDYDEGYAAPFSGEARGAPVTPDGVPVYYSLPEGYGTAVRDGERWRRGPIRGEGRRSRWNTRTFSTSSSGCRLSGGTVLFSVAGWPVKRPMPEGSPFTPSPTGRRWPGLPRGSRDFPSPQSTATSPSIGG